MSKGADIVAALFAGVSRRLLPFADAASDDLPLRRLVRLGLFQVSVGMTAALLTGALNRVMIIELAVPAFLVAFMVSLPLVFAPLRALIGHKSDTHYSALGWRRGPYIWFGSLLQFGGLAIMPFALLVLSGDVRGVEQGGSVAALIGQAGAALAFLLVGAGMHTTQTAGLALATDISPTDARPRVVALLYVMLLIGMGGGALVFGFFLRDFEPVKLIQVIQGTAIAAIALNLIALWKQEPRNAAVMRADAPRHSFREAWAAFTAAPGSRRLLVAVGLGSAGFGMQEVLLEPYGGEILSLTVSETTALTALFAGGTLGGLALAARRLSRGAEPHRLAAFGALVGVFAFSAVLFADPLGAPMLFRFGVVGIGFGGGLFAVGTLTAAMALAALRDSGLALGAWGAVQATATGLAIAVGGGLRDVVQHVAATGALGPALTGAGAGYGVVYHTEILLLFATLAAIGPLARPTSAAVPQANQKFGLAAFPG